MSRYLILLLLNIPLILVSVLSIVTQYNVGRSTFAQLAKQTVFWLLILTGLAMAEPLYKWLFSNKLTQSEPLSLFDVIQITAIIMILYFVNKQRARTDALERRVRDLHQKLAIQLSEHTKKD